ncbi:ABC transporter permease [Lawsonibacter sp. OA9]|uniref:ABC transporter permease n=1 Tax=Oscillospiraceae TaxID=216572 RepID=UPI001F069271|nr:MULTISPECIES: ABC transporter permease [Oscillospiraceae]MCH1980909.1 ABC transporter permease [Lawsonibacter sp. OA9]MCH1981506.1 ABC transporter permease [Ruminococcus sp. OA3]
MESQSNKNFLTTLKKQGIVFAMILVYVVFAVISKQFRTPDNFVLIFRQVATIAVMGAGMTFVIIGGNFDLSVGSLLSLCSVICIDLHDKIGPVPAILVTLVVGMASGVISGYLCGYLRLNSMIVTLGMMNVLQALAMMYTNGQFVQMADSNAWFTKIGKGSIGPVPISTIIMALFIIIMGIVLTKTVYGHHVMSVGGNDEACRYSGINDKLVILKTFVLSGLATAVGAIMLCSRGAAAQATIGETYEFDVISGVILGGASLSGGSGSVYKTFVGVMILGILKNGFVIVGLPYYLQWVAQCVVILIAVYMDIMTKRKKGV